MIVVDFLGVNGMTGQVAGFFSAVADFIFRLNMVGSPLPIQKP